MYAGSSNWSYVWLEWRNGREKEESEDKETKRKRCPTRLGWIKQMNQGWEGKTPFIISSIVYDMIYTESENYPSPNSPQTKVQKVRWLSPSLMGPMRFH